MSKDRVFGKFTSNKIDNSKLSIGASSEVVYHINSSGTDTSSNIYFDFGRPAEAITIRASAACSLTELNGKTLKSPLANPLVGSVELITGFLLST